VPIVAWWLEGAGNIGRECHGRYTCLFHTHVEHQICLSHSACTTILLVLTNLSILGNWEGATNSVAVSGGRGVTEHRKGGATDKMWQHWGLGFYVDANTSLWEFQAEKERENLT
jgi:hypothetical protein